MDEESHPFDDLPDLEMPDSPSTPNPGASADSPRSAAGSPHSLGAPQSLGSRRPSLRPSLSVFLGTAESRATVTSLGNAEYALLEKEFRELDQDGNGELSLGELEGHDISGIGITKELFQRIDKDRSGTINFSEFVRCVFPNIPSRELTRHDQNALSFSEFKVLQEHWSRLVAQTAELGFDTDLDGGRENPFDEDGRVLLWNGPRVAIEVLRDAEFKLGGLQFALPDDVELGAEDFPVLVDFVTVLAALYPHMHCDNLRRYVCIHLPFEAWKVFAADFAEIDIKRTGKITIDQFVKTASALASSDGPGNCLPIRVQVRAGMRSPEWMRVMRQENLRFARACDKNNTGLLSLFALLRGWFYSIPHAAMTELHRDYVAEVRDETEQLATQKEMADPTFHEDQLEEALRHVQNLAGSAMDVDQADTDAGLPDALDMSCTDPQEEDNDPVAAAEREFARVREEACRFEGESRLTPELIGSKDKRLQISRLAHADYLEFLYDYLACDTSNDGTLSYSEFLASTSVFSQLGVSEEQFNAFPLSDGGITFENLLPCLFPNIPALHLRAHAAIENGLSQQQGVKGLTERDGWRFPVRHLSWQRYLTLVTLFNQLDTAGEGQLSFKTLKRADLKAIGVKAPITKAQWQALDIDRSGTASLREVIQFMYPFVPASTIARYSAISISSTDILKLRRHWDEFVAKSSTADGTDVEVGDGMLSREVLADLIFANKGKFGIYPLNVDQVRGVSQDPSESMEGPITPMETFLYDNSRRGQEIINTIEHQGDFIPLKSFVAEAATPLEEYKVLPFTVYHSLYPRLPESVSFNDLMVFLFPSVAPTTLRRALSSTIQPEEYLSMRAAFGAVSWFSRAQKERRSDNPTMIVTGKQPTLATLAAFMAPSVFLNETEYIGGHFVDSPIQTLPLLTPGLRPAAVQNRIRAHDLCVFAEIDRFKRRAIKLVDVIRYFYRSISANELSKSMTKLERAYAVGARPSPEYPFPPYPVVVDDDEPAVPNAAEEDGEMIPEEEVIDVAVGAAYTDSANAFASESVRRSITDLSFQDFVMMLDDFNVIDVDGSGELSYSELKNASGSLGWLKIDPIEFRKLDRDRSGTVSFIELLRGIFPNLSTRIIARRMKEYQSGKVSNKTASNPDTQKGRMGVTSIDEDDFEHLYNAWLTIDAKGDGEVTFEELQESKHLLGDFVVTEKIFHEVIDKDGSGSCNLIEFLRAFYPRVPQPDLQRFFVTYLSRSQVQWLLSEWRKITHNAKSTPIAQCALSLKNLLKANRRFCGMYLDPDSLDGFHQDSGTVHLQDVLALLYPRLDSRFLARVLLPVIPLDDYMLLKAGFDKLRGSSPQLSFSEFTSAGQFGNPCKIPVNCPPSLPEVRQENMQHTLDFSVFQEMDLGKNGFITLSHILLFHFPSVSQKSVSATIVEYDKDLSEQKEQHIRDGQKALQMHEKSKLEELHRKSREDVINFMGGRPVWRGGSPTSSIGSPSRRGRQTASPVIPRRDGKHIGSLVLPEDGARPLGMDQTAARSAVEALSSDLSGAGSFLPASATGSQAFEVDSGAFSPPRPLSQRKAEPVFLALSAESPHADSPSLFRHTRTLEDDFQLAVESQWIAASQKAPVASPAKSGKLNGIAMHLLALNSALHSQQTASARLSSVAPLTAHNEPGPVIDFNSIIASSAGGAGSGKQIGSVDYIPVSEPSPYVKWVSDIAAESDAVYDTSVGEYPSSGFTLPALPKQYRQQNRGSSLPARTGGQYSQNHQHKRRNLVAYAKAKVAVWRDEQGFSHAGLRKGKPMSTARDYQSSS